MAATCQSSLRTRIVGINATEFLACIFNDGDSVTMFEIILVLFRDKGVAVVIHTSGHVHNLGYTFCTLFVKILNEIEHMVP